jgi:hypothetical protein
MHRQDKRFGEKKKGQLPLCSFFRFVARRLFRLGFLGWQSLYLTWFAIEDVLQLRFGAKDLHAFLCSFDS